MVFPYFPLQVRKKSLWIVHSLQYTVRLPFFIQSGKCGLASDLSCRRLFVVEPVVFQVIVCHFVVAGIRAFGYAMVPGELPDKFQCYPSEFFRQSLREFQRYPEQFIFRPLMEPVEAEVQPSVLLFQVDMLREYGVHCPVQFDDVHPR